MIVIVSNGKPYSLHAIYFVEAPSIEAVEAVLHPVNPHDEEEKLNPEARVLGEAPSLRWTADAADQEYSTMSLAAFAKEAKSYL